MSDNDRPWYETSEHLGVFKSHEEKARFYADKAVRANARATLERLAAGAEAKRLATLAKNAGAGELLGDDVREALHIVAAIAPLVEFLPEAERTEWLKLIAKVVTVLANVFGKA